MHERHGKERASPWSPPGGGLEKGLQSPPSPPIKFFGSPVYPSQTTAITVFIVLLFFHALVYTGVHLSLGGGRGGGGGGCWATGLTPPLL